jgi:hypothetical protein
MFFRKKALLAKIETTYGIDSAPTGAANAMLANDISIEPMQGADQDRGHDTVFLGANATIPYDLHATMSFKVELVPSGAAGTAPAWGPLLRACGVAETVTASTSVVYNPISDAFESVTLYLHVDGHLFTLTGSRGTCDITVNASGIPYLEFAFTGLWTKPTDAALPTPDLAAFQKPLLASNVNTPLFTIAGTDHVLRSFKMAFGNQIEPRFLIGREEIVITDRADTIEAQIEATALSTLDPFALARDQTAVALALTHGTGAGRIAALAIPTAQMMRPGTPTEAQGIMEWPLNMIPLPGTGNDQWTLTLT